MAATWTEYSINRAQAGKNFSVNLEEKCMKAHPTVGAKLNPRWVETLMGLPIGWTMPSCTKPVTIELMSCDCSETESCQPVPNELGECSVLDFM